MMKFFSIAMISAAALVASPAMASTVNIDLSMLNTAQSQNGPVSQAALSVAARVGTVGNNDTVDSTAANIGNNASMTVKVKQ